MSRVRLSPTSGPTLDSQTLRPSQERLPHTLGPLPASHSTRPSPAPRGDPPGPPAVAPRILDPAALVGGLGHLGACSERQRHPFPTPAAGGVRGFLKGLSGTIGQSSCSHSRGRDSTDSEARGAPASPGEPAPGLLGSGPTLPLQCPTLHPRVPTRLPQGWGTLASASRPREDRPLQAVPSTYP